ncbi:transposase [Burkholderia lata]|nr:transposase [Burkholderia lata]
MTKQRRTFSPEFKQQAACLVLDQGYLLRLRSDLHAYGNQVYWA